MRPAFYSPVPGYTPGKIDDTFGKATIRLPVYEDVRDGGHTGGDFRCPIGTPVRATAAGRIYTLSAESSDCGHGVRLDHARGWTSSVCHLDAPSPLAVLDFVRAGEVIGFSGESGNAEYPHVHASWEYFGVRRDPLLLLEPTHGANLRRVQRKLVTVGFLDPTAFVPSEWGPATAAAVAAWQGKHRLDPTGSIDALTVAVMFRRKRQPAAG